MYNNGKTILILKIRLIYINHIIEIDNKKNIHIIINDL